MAIDIDLNLPATRVVRTLEAIAAWRGYPAKLCLDNGPEFIALALAKWAERKNIALDFIAPERPIQNGFIERSMAASDVACWICTSPAIWEKREHAEQWLAD